QAEAGIRDGHVTGVQTCALPILPSLSTRRVRGGGPPRRTGPPPRTRRVDRDGTPSPSPGRRSGRARRGGRAPARCAARRGVVGRSEERRVGKEGRLGWWM